MRAWPQRAVRRSLRHRRRVPAAVRPHVPALAARRPVTRMHSNRASLAGADSVPRARRTASAASAAAPRASSPRSASSAASCAASRRAARPACSSLWSRMSVCALGASGSTGPARRSLHGPGRRTACEALCLCLLHLHLKTHRLHVDTSPTRQNTSAAPAGCRPLMCGQGQAAAGAHAGTPARAARRRPCSTRGERAPACMPPRCGRACSGTKPGLPNPNPAHVVDAGLLQPRVH